MLGVEITYYLIIIVYNWLHPIPSFLFLFLFSYCTHSPGYMDGTAKIYVTP